MSNDIKACNDAQTDSDKAICDRLVKIIDGKLPEAKSKIWHRHPVWFLDGNPIVGYRRLKAGIRSMLWSGASFDEEKLRPGTGKFKDASIFFNSASEVNTDDLKRWLEKSKTIQWDYKNVAKRRGVLERLN